MEDAGNNFYPETVAWYSFTPLRGADILPYNGPMIQRPTPKQARFVEEYLIDLNGTQAAIRAGYSAKTAAQQASRLLRNVKVQQAIATGQKELAQRRLWTTERLIDEAETNLVGARSGGKWASANGALDLIGRVTGILSDKPREQVPVITRVTVVLNRGADPEGRPQVEAESYRVLPTAPELPPGLSGGGPGLGRGAIPNIGNRLRGPAN